MVPQEPLLLPSSPSPPPAGDLTLPRIQVGLTTDLTAALQANGIQTAQGPPPVRCLSSRNGNTAYQPGFRPLFWLLFVFRHTQQWDVLDGPYTIIDRRQNIFLTWHTLQRRPQYSFRFFLGFSRVFFPHRSYSAGAPVPVLQPGNLNRLTSGMASVFIFEPSHKRPSFPPQPKKKQG